MNMFKLIAFLLCPCSLIAGEIDANKIMSDSQLKGGLVVHLDCGDGRDTEPFAADGRFLVHGLEKDQEKVADARSYLLGKGLYGRVQISEYDGKTLPYVDHLVNIIVAGSSCKVSSEEIMRVLAPYGVAIIGGRKIQKEWPSEMDHWPHYLRDAGNNAVGQDKIAGYPRAIKWLASPVWTRHHDKQASMSSLVSSNGRIYYVLDNGPVFSPNYKPRWMLEARDAFNGLLLWQQPMKSWVSHQRPFRKGPVQLARLLVADGDRVFASMGIHEPVSVINGQDGKVIRKLESTAKAEEMVFHEGVLVLLCADKAVEHSYTEGNDYVNKAIQAVDPDTGGVLWRYPKEGFKEFLPQTLAASDNKVVIHETDTAVCLDLKKGDVLWSTKAFGADAPMSDDAMKDRTQNKGRKTGWYPRSPGWVYYTLVIAKDVVLTSDNSQVYALSLKDGKLLWRAPAETAFNKTPAVDILVLDEVVWVSHGFDKGFDLHTGEVVKQLDNSLVTTRGHHHRCYRNKGLRNFVVYGWRGLEYLDTTGEEHSRNNWVRGLCQYGVMPANGVMYAPPHSCGCYFESLIHGFWALSAEDSHGKVAADFRGKLQEISSVPTNGVKPSASDWPMYRANALRGGVSSSEVSKTMKEVWKVEIGGKITAPVSACGTVLVAGKDTHTVYALEESTGKRIWAYTAGGRVDSPPTVNEGTVLFGCADGMVYCLSLQDGKLLWRFDAVPTRRSTVVMGDVESVWPINGSIMVKNGTAYFTAGRSTYIDGGLFLYGLDAITGKVRYYNNLSVEHTGAIKRVAADVDKKAWSDYKTKLAPDHSDAFSMYGNRGDIMLADDDSVYLRHMRFNEKLEENREPKHHLFSTDTLLEDSESHRLHWFYGVGDFSGVPVSYEWMTRNRYGGFNIPFGKLLVYDPAMLWGIEHQNNGKSLFATDISDLDKRHKKDFPVEGKQFGGKKLWRAAVGMHARAMVKAGDFIIVAGAKETGQLMETGKGGLLRMFTASSGKNVLNLDLEDVPVFDGMAAANGRLLLSNQRGEVVCFK